MRILLGSTAGGGFDAADRAVGAFDVVVGRGADLAAGLAGAEVAVGTATGARQLRQAKRRPAYCSLTLNVEPQAAQLTGIDIRLPEALLSNLVRQT